MPKPPDPVLREWNTVKQVAAYLQCTSLTVYGWLKDGTLESTRLSPRTIRISAVSVDKMLEKSRH